ncbi:hypothetical protein RYX36_030756 [Vicia faba]
MGNNAFDRKILTEKLRKLNNSQQSIESVSRLCVSHRERAKDIVETWNKLFSSSQKDQRVPFLNLANDILQTSKRKGNEFVNEFWKVLPSALKRVYASDESGKNSVIRLAAQNQIERVDSIRKRFIQAPEATWVPEQNIPPVQPNSIPFQPSLTQPTMSFSPLQTIEEDTKAAAAAVAARLAASTSSALMLTSVLSSLVAEEAASMNGSLNSVGYPSPPPGFYPEKRPKLERHTPVSDINSSDTRNSSFFATLQQPPIPTSQTPIPFVRFTNSPHHHPLQLP